MRFWLGLFLVFCLAGIVIAEEAGGELVTEVTSLRERVSQLESERSQYERSVGEAGRLRREMAEELDRFLDRVERERDRLLSFLTWALMIAGILVGFVLWLVGREFGQVREDLVARAREELVRTADEMKHEADKILRERFQDALQDIDAQLNHLNAAVGREVRYRTARVAVVGNAKELRAMRLTEIPALQAHGLSILPIDRRMVFEKRDVFKAIDLIVYRYTGDSFSLVEFLHLLSDRFLVIEERPPVIIYTEERVNVEAVAEYGMATFANTVPALISHVLVHAFFLLRPKGHTN